MVSIFVYVVMILNLWVIVKGLVMTNIFFWIVFLPLRIFQYIIFLYFTLRGYEYVEVEPNKFIWVKKI